MRPTEVSVVIVSYNTRDKLRHCLSCIESDYEVIVIDNASADGSADMVASEFPHVSVIRNEDNVGFGAANNQGIAQAKGELVLLLNSDAYARPGAIRKLASVFVDQRVVAAGGKLLNPDGTLQESAASKLTLWRVFCEQTYLEMLLPWSKLFNGYWLSARLLQAGDKPQPVEQVMGACLMMRPVARFDERYFLYCEDTDLCRRIRPLGEILYVPEAVFVHELGSSSSASRWLAVARYNRGKELYFSVRLRPYATRTVLFAPAICWLLDRIGALLRLIVWGIPAVLTLFTVPCFRNQVVLFFKVLTAPVMGPRLPTRKP